MIDMKGKDKVGDSQGRIHPSETEISRLLQEAVQQYKECIRLTDLADIADQGELNHPRFSWDNPIGLVVMD